MERSDTLLTPEKKLKRFEVHYTWIYVTERCNLHCDYCFFRHMHGREISLDAVEQLFKLFERLNPPKTLICSGGEAFLAKENLFKILTEVRQRFPKTSPHIQTNGLLIDDEDILKLSDLGVSLEFGIDGKPKETIKHRCGLKPASYDRLTTTIQKCLKAGIFGGSTMTVHPEEVDHMEEGLDFLRGLGLPHVDVTPAAFMPWTPETVAKFKTNYLALSRRPELRKLAYANEDQDWIKPGVMDLSLHPPGYLFGGDPFLCLPEEKRAEFTMWDPATGELRPEVLAIYDKAYADMHRQHPKLPYREHVCHNFELMNTMMGEQYMNTWAINDIMRFLTRTHLTLKSVKHGQ